MAVSPVCRWKSKTVADYEVEIRRCQDGRGLEAVLINRPMNIEVDRKPLPLTTVFERCVWKSNEFPVNDSLDSRFFRQHNTKKATWIGIDFNNNQARLFAQTFSNFDDTELQTKALVFNVENQQVGLQPVSSESNPYNDSQAELGMIRPTATGEEEIVHIWSRVGTDGKCDLRLIRQRNLEQEDLILQLFYRSTWNITNIRLLNQFDLLINRAYPIRDRITSYGQHPIAILGERSGNAYGTVSLSSPADAGPGLENFCEERNLQSTTTDEIATYVRDKLLVVRDAGGQITNAVASRDRVVVTRERPHDFGLENGGKLDAIHIHMSQKFQMIRTPFAAIAAFFSGIGSHDAPQIHQLYGLDKIGMQDVMQESTGLATPLNKIAIFRHFDRAIEAGANIDYYIAENRRTARFVVAGFSLACRSVATSLGRGISLRFLWDPLPAQTPNVHRARQASQAFIRASNGDASLPS